MADYIDISDVIGQSVINATVRPASDGSFVLKFRFASTSTNAKPEMWGEFSGDIDPYSSPNHTAWENGSTGLREVLRKVVDLKGGKTYSIKAQGKNLNAKADDASLSITRLP